MAGEQSVDATWQYQVDCTHCHFQAIGTGLDSPKQARNMSQLWAKSHQPNSAFHQTEIEVEKV